jgi:divalent metal cation (Fe/Co/Zn/Cd) transporter
MDRMPDGPIVEQIDTAARGVDGVRATEKIRVRKLGAQFFVDLHVQADPMLPLFEAHILSGKVKGAILSAVPNVAGVLIHMEPFDGEASDG